MNFSFEAAVPVFGGVGASRRPRATMEVMLGFSRPWRINSVATKPVEPPITSFIMDNSIGDAAHSKVD